MYTHRVFRLIFFNTNVRLHAISFEMLPTFVDSMECLDYRRWVASRDRDWAADQQPDASHRQVGG